MPAPRPLSTLTTSLPRSLRHFSTPPSSSSPSSVSASEVTHFDALASSWWDPHGSSRLLHLMNPLRHRFLRNCLSLPSPSPSLRLLDVGCGGGIFSESAARSPLISSVTAIDPTPSVISIAQRHRLTDPALLSPGRLTYLNIPIEELPLPNKPSEGYDVISLFEVIEHIQNPSPFLANVLRHLKPGGWLVGSTIARTATAWVTTKFVAEEVLGFVPRGTHDWNQYINPGELRDWAGMQGELEVGAGGKGDGWRVMGVVYVPGLGWREVGGSEEWGNYFFGMRKVGGGEREGGAVAE